MSGNGGLVTIIYITIAICVLLAIILAAVLGYIWYRDNKKKKETQSDETKAKNGETSTKLQGIESMSKFLEFDEVVDSMIVRKNRTQYVMVIQCKGVNFDLLGQEEKIAIENGFVQFLNVLRFPVQLYIQTRSLNLKDSIDNYNQRVNEVKEEIMKIESQIKRERANGRLDLVRRLEFERRRKVNILEYGLDITNYVSKISQNRNVLQQNTYVVVSYYTSEFGGEIANYSKEEVDNIAFSELYTRAQTVIRGLASAGVSGRVINSEELAELLYIAYNRDDSELINIRKSVEAQYDSLYNTAKDILDKQKEMIEEKVEKEAIQLAASSITKADRIRKLRKDNQEEIKSRALNYIESYKGDMTEDLYNEAKRQIEKADITGEKKNEQKAIKKEEEKVRAEARARAVARRKAQLRKQAEEEMRTEAKTTRTIKSNNN